MEITIMPSVSQASTLRCLLLSPLHGQMPPLEGMDAFYIRPRAALALALGYWMKPHWGLT